MEERLQKYLAQAGIASRRAAESLIMSGEVRVNGAAVPVGTKIDPEQDVVTYRGVVVKPAARQRYLLLHKPPGFVTTHHDPQGRKTVFSLLPDCRERLFSVGRLDMETSGLLLLTNDGDFAYALTHPKFQVKKCYLATVEGAVQPAAIAQLQNGIRLDDGLTAPAKVQIVHAHGRQTTLEIWLHEGRKRQVRRMCAAVGHPVERLERVQLGNLRLGNLPSGQARDLTPREVAGLRQIALQGEREGEMSDAD